MCEPKTYPKESPHYRECPQCHTAMTVVLVKLHGQTTPDGSETKTEDHAVIQGDHYKQCAPKGSESKTDDQATIQFGPYNQQWDKFCFEWFCSEACLTRHQSTELECLKQ